MTTRVVTNNVPREIVWAHELSATERAELDYIDWAAVDRGELSASFARYEGEVYDLGEFSRDFGITKGSGLPDGLNTWDGYLGESYFSAVVVRFVGDDHVIMGRVLS